MWILGHDLRGHYNRLALVSVDIISGAFCSIIRYLKFSPNITIKTTTTTRNKIDSLSWPFSSQSLWNMMGNKRARVWVSVCVSILWENFRHASFLWSFSLSVVIDAFQRRKRASIRRRYQRDVVGFAFSNTRWFFESPESTLNAIDHGRWRRWWWCWCWWKETPFSYHRDEN